MEPETRYDIIYKGYKIEVTIYSASSVVTLLTPTGNLVHFCEQRKRWWDFGTPLATKTISQIEAYKRMVDERVGFHATVTEYIEGRK